MVTKQLGARPETFFEYEEEVKSRRQTCQYCIDRGINALTVLLFGLGVLSFFVGLCTDVLTVGQGVIGWVALWVVAYTIRVYYGRWERFDASDYRD
jgi:prepilin signal peptidase PulO-like enzyme (type II secretory pathway)